MYLVEKRFLFEMTHINLKCPVLLGCCVFVAVTKTFLSVFLSNNFVLAVGG